MKINLEDKSMQYVEVLRECIEKYKDTDKRKLAIFLKYADTKSGLLKNREGLLKLMNPLMQQSLFILHKESLTTCIIVNGTLNDRTVINEELGYVTMRMISTEQAVSAAGKVSMLLWVKRREWLTHIGELRCVNLVQEMLYLKILDTQLSEGYFFDTLKIAGRRENV